MFIKQTEDAVERVSKVIIYSELETEFFGMERVIQKKN